MSKILVVDDDRETCRMISQLLKGPGREFEFAYAPDTALRLARAQPFDLIISDINLNTELTGLDVLRAFKAANPSCQVLLISGFGTLETAMEAVRAGAFDYISKPFNISEIKLAAQRALDQVLTEPALRPAVDEARQSGLIGSTPGMLAVYNQIARSADSAVPVLIIGESGTGKELVARALHANSRRSDRPFVAVNCGAITESLVESELFGHSRGAFTGAVTDRKGIFEQAQGGTVFLDEIGETSLSVQVKLLRVLELGEVRPVGATRVVHVDNRVIAATNAHIERAVADKRFRDDLYYRLNVIVITIPPLRERRDDIPLLVNDFSEKACTRAGRRVDLAPETLALLVAYDWPGNVRQLENTIERLVLLNRGTVISPVDLPPEFGNGRRDVLSAAFEDLPALEELERRYLLHVLKAVGGNRTRAAAVMGVDRRTLYRMAARFGVPLTEELS